MMMTMVLLISDSDNAAAAAAAAAAQPPTVACKTEGQSEIRTRRVHVFFARLAPTCGARSVLIDKKFPHRSPVGSLSRVRVCRLGF